LDKLGVVLEQFGVILDNNGVVLDYFGNTKTSKNLLIEPKNAKSSTFHHKFLKISVLGG
jgi:hypothetical protein